MTPDVLSVQPAAPPRSRAAGWTAPVRHVISPIVLSALTAGVWTGLAFFHALGHARSILVGMAAALGYAVCFAAATASSRHWVSDPDSAAWLQQQLARCSFASVVLALFFPEYLARLSPPLLRSCLLLAIAALLWFALCGASILRARGFALRQVVAHRIAAVSLVLLFLATTALAIRKYLVFAYVGQDLAYFGQIMHTTLHGHLFWGSLLQDLIYSRPVSTDFAGHNSPVMFFFVPFYALFPSPITLLVLRNLVLIACAVPVFLLARRRVSPATAWLWAAAFLLAPAILYQSVFDFYPLTFVALPLLFTLYFYLQRRYTAFCACLGMSLLVREDLVFFVFGLGLLALLHRRSARWIFVPLAAATAWAVLSFLVVLPAALHGATYVTDTCFSHLGHAPSAMIRNVVFHPRENILVHGNIVYLKTLLTPTALVLSFASPVSLLALPYVAINLLAGAGRCITTVIFAQYSVIPAALLFAGSLLSLTGRGRFARFGSLGLRIQSAAPLLLIALGCASLVFVTDKAQLDDFREPAWGREAHQVLRIIPPGASVAAPRYMLPHLANRDCLYQTHRLLQYHSAVYEYLIIDTDWTHINAASDYRIQYEEVERQAASDPGLQLIYSSPRYRVYRNPALHGRSCQVGATTTATTAFNPSPYIQP